MKKSLIIFILLFGSVVNAQVELAIQKGHSSDVERLVYSNNGELLLSFAKNNEGILWDLSLSKALTSFKIPDYLPVIGVKFDEKDENIKIQTSQTTYFFNLENDRLIGQLSDEDSLFRDKTYYDDPNGIYEVYIHKGNIKKRKKGKRFTRYWISVNYTTANFTAFDVSLENDLIVGVAEDQVIYVHHYSNGKKITTLQGHNSAILDVKFSPDGKYFATTGEDRSIIIWNTSSLKMEDRLYSNIFRKNTATFSYDGKYIFLGDELGTMYAINFGSAFPVVETRIQPQSINLIRKGNMLGQRGYFVGTSDNTLEFKTGYLAEEAVQKFDYREHAFLQSKNLLLQNNLGFYQEPFGEVQYFDQSPNEKFIVFTGKSDIPNLTLVNLEKNKSEHLYAYNEWRNWSAVQFITNNEFVAFLDTAKELYFWKFNKQLKCEFHTESFPFIIKNILVLDSNRIWINAADEGQFIYEKDTRIFKRKHKMKGSTLMLRNEMVVLSNDNHELVFFNPIDYSEIARLKGHSALVSDCNFHPQRDLCVTSSNDGTIRLWNFNEQSLIASIIPFKSNDLVIVTSDNYYLISKGAFGEIGFKFKGKFFYPDQFDLKYNRPDIVLERLGYSNDELIEAYYKAYQKRLKKMNFNESDLTSEFHLPEIAIENKGEIPLVIDHKNIKLQLALKDSEVKLDRYNVWVNDVAILGINGKNIRDKDAKQLKETVALDLGFGENKIEVSVLNQSGAESYKQAINVYCTDGKEKPDAYIVTLGVSHYKNKDYNLAYAAKDAEDVENLFLGNDYFETVSTKTFTDEQVTLENLSNIKTFLSQAEVDDLVLVFVAGHGVLDEDFNYYFASYDMDFDHPGGRGIPYEKIEELLDGIKALKKLLILDTCHGGELDKDEVEKTEGDNQDPGNWEFRGAGVDVAFKEDPLGFENTNNLMRSLFLDLRKGTGATVIASSGGAEYALESSKYENGLFTYCLIDALNNEKADLNKDKRITISELQIFLRAEVKRLSNGSQVPTSRIQNKELDYQLW